MLKLCKYAQIYNIFLSVEETFNIHYNFMDEQSSYPAKSILKKSSEVYFICFLFIEENVVTNLWFLGQTNFRLVFMETVMRNKECRAGNLKPMGP